MSSKRTREEPEEELEEELEDLSPLTDDFDKNPNNVELVKKNYDPRFHIHKEIPNLNVEQIELFNLLSWKKVKNMIDHSQPNTLAKNLDDIIEEEKEDVGRYTRELESHQKKEREYQKLFPKKKRVRSASFGEGGKRRKTKKSRTKKSRTKKIRKTRRR